MNGSTLAPAAIAFWMTVRHCARLCVIDEVEHICPIALGWSERDEKDGIIDKAH